MTGKAFRIWRRRPAHVLGAILPAALGLALTIALTAVANAIWFLPLPVPHPEQILRVYSASDLHPLGFVSYPDYEDLARSIKNVVAQTQVILALGSAGEATPETRMGLAISENYFDVLHVRPRLGRTFEANDSGRAVVILSERFWANQLQKDPAILNKSITLAGVSFVVVGVMPREFGLDRFLHEDFYVLMDAYNQGILPATGRPWEDRGRRYLTVYVRANESSIGEIEASKGELDMTGRILAAQYPETNRNQRIIAVTEAQSRQLENSGLARVAAVLAALAMVGLVGACVALATFLLAENENHVGDTALKLALGARPVQLLFDVLLESVALVVPAFVAAIPLASAALRVFDSFSAPMTDLAISFDAQLDRSTLWIASSFVFALIPACAIPAWWASHGRTHKPGAGMRATRSGRLRNFVLAFEAMLAAALCAGALYSLLAIRASRQIQWGFRTDHLLLAVFDPSQVRYDKNRGQLFYEELLRRAAGLPGVRGAALVQSVPLGFTGAQKGLKLGEQKAGVWMNTVTPGYFAMMQLPLISGREFDESDDGPGTRRVIVNERMRELWPQQIAVGRSIEIDGQSWEIVGIARTVKYSHWAESKRPYFYLPFSQNYSPRMTLILDIFGDVHQPVRGLRQMVRQIDSVQPVSGIMLLEHQISRGTLYIARLSWAVATAAACVVLLVSLFGVYATTRAAAQRKRREIAVCKALGAPVWKLLRDGAAQIVGVCLFGTCFGAALGSQLFPFFAQIMPEIGVREKMFAVAAGTALVALCSLGAALIPVSGIVSEDVTVALAVEEKS